MRLNCGAVCLLDPAFPGTTIRSAWLPGDRGELCVWMTLLRCGVVVGDTRRLGLYPTSPRKALHAVVSGAKKRTVEKYLCRPFV